MLASAIIVFREVLEAGLIVGIVLAATQGVPGRGRFIAGGIAIGVLSAGVLAAFASTVSNALAGMGQEVFNANILGVAVVMLAWHNIWMARHGRELAADLKAVGEDVRIGNRTLFALGTVVCIAVLREGAEVVLFLYGVVLSSGEKSRDLFAGGLFGLAAGASVTALTYLGLLKIPGRYLFGVTSTLIAFLAAGMAAQCVAFLEQAGIVTVFSSTLWDTSTMLPATGALGRVLHTLIGYNDQPTALQAAVYVLTLGSIFTLMRIFSPSRQKVQKKAPVNVAGQGSAASVRGQ